MENQSGIRRRWSTEVKLGTPRNPKHNRRSPDILPFGRTPRVIPLIQLDRDKARAAASVQPAPMHSLLLQKLESPHIANDKKTEKPKRKYTTRQPDQMVEATPLAQRKWLTFKQAAALYPQSEQAFRHLARQAEQYQKYPKAGLPSNGFEQCIVRQPGSRNIYLNAEALERWMARGQGGAS